MALFGTTLLGKCSKLIRFDSMTLADAGATGLELDPGIAVPVLAAMAVVVPTGQAVRRWWKDGDGNKPELDIAPEKPPESVVSIFQVLADARNGTASGDLDAELADLMDEPDWEEVNRRLDEAAREWCKKQIKEKGVRELKPDELREVLLSLVRNVREAPYRDEFADHYRRIFSVDRRDRSEVGDVFIRLKADVRRDAPGELDVPEYLDFRGDTPTGIETMLRQLTSHNLVILGEPGSGKSTLLRYLALSCAQSEAADPLLPVFLPLRAYAAGEDILIADSALTFAEGALQGVMPDGFFEDALSSGRCLVCLDALDEVPAGERYDIVRKVETLVGRYPDSRFIVTSRLAGYDETPLDSQIFTRYVVQPMDDNGVSAFIDWRFADDLEDDPERAQNLRDVLNANPNIKSLVSNPLLMAMLNMVYRGDDQEGLPLKRAGFYKKAVEVLIEDEDFSVDSDDRRRPFFKYQEDILAAIAHQMQSEGDESIRKNDLARQVARFLVEEIKIGRREARPEAQAFVELAERRTGLLVGEKADNPTEFRFPHSTFREYLAARHIYLKHYLDEPDDFWEEIKDHIADDRWQEVIVFLLSGFEEDEREYCAYLTEKILAAGDEAIHQLNDWSLPTHLQLTAEALANQSPMSPALQQIIVGLLERMAIGVPDIRRGSRYMAVNALGAIGHIPEVVTAALTAISSDTGVSYDLRFDAALALAEFVGEERIISLLIAMFTDPTFRSWDRIYDRATLGDDILLFAGTEAKAWHAASLIGICSDPDIDIDSRVRAAWELAESAEWATAISLLDDICKDPEVDARSRVDAARALGMLGEQALAISLLADICKDPAVDARSRAAAVREAGELGILGEETKVGSLLADICKDPAIDAYSRVHAALELVTVADLTPVPDEEEKKAGIALLTDIATNPAADTWERVAAAEALAFLGEWEKAIPLLRDIYNAPDANSRVSVDLDQNLEIHGEWEKKISLSSLSDADLPTDAWRGVSAAYSVWTQGWGLLSSLDLVYFLASSAFPSEDNIEDEHVISLLNDVGNDPAANASERVIAAVGLRIVEEIEKAILLLTDIANDETVDDIGRLCAALYIGDQDASEWNPLAINVLTAVSGDETVNPALRFEAGKALADLEANEVAIPALTDVAGNVETYAEVRIEAAKVLWSLGDKAAGETALKAILAAPALSDANRNNAREALAAIERELDLLRIPITILDSAQPVP